LHTGDLAANVGVMATMAMAAFGGCWWPLEMVSKPLKTASLLIPSGWAMRALHGLISFGRDLTHLGPEILALVLFSVFFWLLAIRSLRIE
jgi:ABC-type multidrug transport system permease subunit